MLADLLAMSHPIEFFGLPVPWWLLGLGLLVLVVAAAVETFPSLRLAVGAVVSVSLVGWLLVSWIADGRWAGVLFVLLVGSLAVWPHVAPVVRVWWCSVRRKGW